MDTTYWQKQSLDKPLYPDILWSKPESKAFAGKLLVIGGNDHAFGAPGNAYTAALDAGIGVATALLPDAVQKVVGRILPDAHFAPSTPSGSFSRQALALFIELSAWADGVLLAGDFGRNSETAMLLEAYVEHVNGPLTITQDAVEYFRETPLHITDRPQTAIVLSLSQLQKIFINTPTITPITLSMSTMQLVEALHAYTKEHPAAIVTKHHDIVFVAYEGRVSTTQHTEQIWRVTTAATAATWWVQNPTQLFEAATTALATAEHE